jgi:hypothetical protein
LHLFAANPIRVFGVFRGKKIRVHPCSSVVKNAEINLCVLCVLARKPIRAIRVPIFVSTSFPLFAPVQNPFRVFRVFRG